MKQNSDEHTSNSPLEEDMRDLILAYVKAKNADDDAMALADEFFEWLHPVLMQREETLYSDETELRRAYIELTS